jgi:hypothetical protein
MPVTVGLDGKKNFGLVANLLAHNRKISPQLIQVNYGFGHRRTHAESSIASERDAVYSGCRGGKMG